MVKANHALSNSALVIKRGKGLDLGAEPPRIKLCWVPRPSGDNPSETPNPVININKHSQEN